MGYYVVPLFVAGPRAPIYGAAFTAIGSLAFFSRFFQKYRKLPPFQDNVHVFDARIYGPFLLLILTLLMKPTEAAIYYLPYVAEVLGTVSLPTMFTFVWIYFYYLFFEWSETAKFTPLYSRVNYTFSRNVHEIVYFGIYITEIVFLDLLQDVADIWAHMLILLLPFLGLIWVFTTKERKLLRNALTRNAIIFGNPVGRRGKKTPVSPDQAQLKIGEFEDAMQSYLRKVAKLASSLIFLLLFQLILEFAWINITVIRADPNLGGTFAILFCLIGTGFIKVQVDLALRYKRKRSWTTSAAPKFRMLHNFNIILTSIVGGLIFAWSMTSSLPHLALGILLVWTLVVYIEAQGNLYGKLKYYAQLVTWAIIGIELCWGLLPTAWQLLIFLLYMYVILEAFKRLRGFQEKSIAIVQNVIVTGIIFAILYGIYPPVIESYLFSPDPNLQLISHGLFVTFFCLIAIVAVLYRLYFSQFHRHTSRALKITLSLSSLLFLCFLAAISAFRLSSILNASEIWTTVYAAAGIVPILFVGLSSLNFKMGILSREDRQSHLYYSYWSISIILLVAIATIAPTFGGILGAGLYLLIVMQSLFQVGARFNRVSEQFRQRFGRLSSHLMVFLSFVFFGDLFINVLRLDFFFSVFLAMGIMSCMTHVLSLGHLISTKLGHYLTTATLYVLTLTIFLNALGWFSGTLNIYLAPLLLACIAFIWPNLYAWKTLKGKPNPYQTITKVNVQAIAILTSALQVPHYLGSLLAGEQVNVISFLISPFFIYAFFITLFSFMGYGLNFYSKQELSRNCYYAAWPLLPCFIAWILTFSPGLNGISWCVLVGALYLQIMVFWSKAREKLNHGFYNSFTTINSIAFVAGLFWVIYGAFSTLLWGSLLGVFLGLCGVCGAALLFTKFFALYPPKHVKVLTSFTIYFLLVVVLYYSALGFMGGPFGLGIPAMLTAVVSFVPHVVTYKLGLFKRGAFLKLANLSILAIAISLGVVPLVAILTVTTLSTEILVVYSITLPLITFSTIILLLSSLGKMAGLYSAMECSHNQYYATWILIPQIFLLILAFWPISLGYYMGYVTGILFLTISLHFLFKWSVILKKLSNPWEPRLIWLNSVVLASTIISIPFVLGLELLHQGMPFPTLEVLSYTSFILLVCTHLFQTNSASTLLVFGPKVTNRLKRVQLTAWLFVQVMLCFALSGILPMGSMLEEILIIIILGSMLSPVTLVYLKRAGWEAKKQRIFLDQLIAIIYSVALAILYTISLGQSKYSFPRFGSDPTLGFVFGGINLFLFLNWSLVAYKRLTTKFQSQLANDELPERDSPGRKWGAFFSVSLILFLIIFFQSPGVNPIFLGITLTITLKYRNSNPVMRVLQVILLSGLTFIHGMLLNDLLVSDPTNLWQNLALSVQAGYAIGGVNLIYYFISLLIVLTVSITLNRGNLFEALAAFVSISSIILIVLSLFTTILFPNVVAIALVAFLLQLTPFLYYYKYPAAQIIARACVVLIVFIGIQYLSYQVWFLPADFGSVNSTLALTLSASITAFSFVMVFNKLPEKYRRYFYVAALLTIITSIPIFTYFALFEAMPSLESGVLQVISLDIGILLFFLSTGIYQWRFSRSIWEAAWWAWLLLPVVNYVIIVKALTGIDVVTNTLNFFGTMGLSGSIILSVIICTLLYMPVFYTKIRIHFHKILFFVWGETLFLVAWIAQNLFGPNILLSSGFFGIVAIFLLIPLLYLFKAWKILSYFWFALTAIDVIFLHAYLSFLGSPLENVLSIDLIVVGLLSIAYSFFPHLRHRHPIAATSYVILLAGVFFLIYFVIAGITMNPYTSVNISFIILAFSLFSSKYLKLDQKNVHFTISIILISNISLLVLFSLIIIPGLEFFAVSLFLAVFGGSFYVFNYYKMMKTFDNRIPWGIMAVGCALAVSDLCLILWNANLMFLGFTCSLTLLLFFYRYLHQYRYALWVIYPLPFTFFIQALFVPILGSFLIFGFVATYIIFFQIIFNIFHRLAMGGTIFLDRRYLEILEKLEIQKVVNSICFLSNSLFIAIWAAAATPISLINQIFEFLILWSLLTTISLKYMKTAKFDSIGEGFFKFSQGITLMLYFVVPLTLSFNLSEYFILIGFKLSDIIMLIGLIYSGILFVEIFLIDRLVVVNLFPKVRDQLTFWSWIVLGNFSCIQVFLVYENVFFLCLMFSVLNFPSVHFLAPLNVSVKVRQFLRHALLNSIIIEISLYLASVLTQFEQLVLPLAIGAPSTIFFFLIFSLMFLGLNIAIKQFLPGKFFQRLNLGLFFGIQALFAIYYGMFAVIFNATTLPVVIFLVFCETGFSFILLSLWSKCLISEKQKSFLKSGNGGLKFCLTLEVPALLFGLLFDWVGVYENLLISQFSLFLISAIESKIMQQNNKKYAFLLYGFSVYALSITLFVFLSTFFNLLGVHYYLIILMLLFTQLYATRVLHLLLRMFREKENLPVSEEIRIANTETTDAFENARLKVESGTYYILMNTIFLVSAIYLSALATLAIPLAMLGSIPPLLVSAGLFCLIYLLFTAILNRWLPKRVRTLLNLGFFLGFQLWVAIMWLWRIDLQSLGTPTSLNLLVILETILIYFPVQVIDKIRFPIKPEENNRVQNVREHQEPTPKLWRTGGLIFLLYCQLSFLVFNVSFITLPVLESLLLAILTLFVLSALELSHIQKVGRKFIRTIHVMSYIALTILWCGFLLQFTTMHAAIRGLSVFSLIVMQFYTNIAIFNARVRYQPQDIERLIVTKNKIQTILGLCFYGGILFFLQQAISSFDILVQCLALCVGLFGLMALDRARLKFNVEKVSRTVQAMAWAGSLLFLEVLVFPLIMGFFSILPLLLVLNYAGIAYFIKILNFIESLKAKQVRAYQILIIATYFTLTAWPFLFATLDWISFFIVVSIATIILLAFTYADDRASALPERIRLIIRKVCFFVIGGIIAGGFSLLIAPIIEILFFTFRSALNVCLFLLFFMGILALFLRPFQKDSVQALGFWYGIFTLSGLILYFISTSLLAGIIFIATFLLAYWIIYVPAVREFLIKQIRALYSQFLALSVAVKNAVVNAYQKMIAFWRLHFQAIWMTIWAALGVAAFILVWFFFNISIASAIPIGLLIFVMGLFGIIAKQGSEQKGSLSFQNEFLYYASLYFTTTWSLFSFFTWNIFLVLGAVLLFGGVLLFFMDRAWKRERLGYKWRFIAIFSFVLLFGATAFLMIGQYLKWFNVL